MILNTLYREKKEEYEPAVPIGTQWVITKSGTWEVPETGRYEVELHGGGGGTGSRTYYEEGLLPGGSGGGSGEKWTVDLERGDAITVTIGVGGSSPTDNFYQSGTQGGTTTFGKYSIAGGGGGEPSSAAWYPAGNKYLISYGSGGAKSGTLATNGRTASASTTIPGGSGGATIGDYGTGANSGTDAFESQGKPGAAIVTFISL